MTSPFMLHVLCIYGICEVVPAVCSKLLFAADLILLLLQVWDVALQSKDLPFTSSVPKRLENLTDHFHRPVL